MRARLQLSEAGPNADIAIGEMSMPIGFAVHWLAWCDRQTVKRETRFQLRQLFWPVLVTALTLPVVAVWPEVGVPVTVLVAAAGWAFTRGWNSPVNDAIRWLLAASRRLGPSRNSPPALSSAISENLRKLICQSQARS